MIGRLAWLDEPEPDVRAPGPQERCLAGELWPVVQHNNVGGGEPLAGQVETDIE